MKKLAQFLLVLSLLSSVALPQGIVEWACSPAGCFDAMIFVYSGLAWVDATVWCGSNWVPYHCDAGVMATNCRVLVNLSAQMIPLQYSPTGAISCEADANISSAPYTEYWEMYQLQWCDGDSDEYIAPPAPC